jgi:glutamate---cysteine ligase / carboxylate-amine ligase
MPDLSRFGAAPPWSLGVEEELMLVDAETLEPARDGWSRVFGEATDRIKPELFESFVEITTPVVETAEEAEAELRALRLEVAERAAEHGFALLATGSHPTAREAPPIVPVDRYHRLKEQLGPQLYRQTVCGLHVHVSVPDAASCLRAFEGVVPHLPGLLAESANSPYWDGVPSGWRSIRAQILLEMPTGGTPPLLRDWDDWEAATRGDSKRRHWDVWPRPEYGTLELRVMDQPTSLQRTAELAAAAQRLVREAAEWSGEPLDRDEYAAERERAAREGGGPEAERQLELGPERAVAELRELTLTM